MNLGKVNKFKVIRETNLGYILEKDGVEYFLHHNECDGKTLFPNDYVNAFLYADKKNRVAATLMKPLIETGDINFLEVVNVKNEIGVFCNIGISKDILFSRDDLPRSFSEWPKVGDKILCELKEKGDHLVLKAATKSQIIEKHNKLYPESTKLEKGSVVNGYVYRIVAEGINIVTENFEVVFIFKNNFRNKVRLAENLEVKIIDIHEDDYSGTLNKNKEFQIQDDKKIILDYLNKNNGVSLITEKDAPELISKVFNMSKAAFKKAIGGLLKENIIEIVNNKIILIDYKF